MKLHRCVIACTAALAISEARAQSIDTPEPAVAPTVINEKVIDAAASHNDKPREVVVESTTLAPPKKLKEPEFLNNYLPYEKRVAGWVDNTARSIDRFFGTDDAYRVDNDSWLRLTNDFVWEQDKGVSNELRPRLKLDLPTATKRLHLLVESDSDERTALEENVPGLRNENERKRTTVLGLGVDMDSWLPQWKKQIQGGIRVALPFDPYARFIIRRDIPLGGEWELNSYNRLSWFNSDGYSAKSELRLGEPLSPKWRLYYATDFTWREKHDYLQFSPSANLAHILSNRSAITYSLGFSGTGFEGPHIDKYFVAADYRRNIARRIIFLDVIPEISLPDEYGFDPHWAITVRLELYFQKQIDAE